jgi:hypothetical protein
VPADDQPGRIGDYWLSRRPNSAQWCRTWFDAAARQTRRASLGTDDFDAARVALAKWVTLNVTIPQQHPRDVPLATVFARYYQHHGQSVRSGAINRRNLRQMLDILPEGITVDELTIPVQKAASATLHRTHAPATVGRRKLGLEKWRTGSPRPVHLDPLERAPGTGSVHRGVGAPVVDRNAGPCAGVPGFDDGDGGPAGSGAGVGPHSM